jgi:CubicO group peptidase (beta-lactamase class C family)
MKTKKKKKTIVISVAVILFSAWFASSYLIDTHRINQIPQMSYKDILLCVTKNNKKAKITIGIIKDGKVSCFLYGENGSKLPYTEHTYEIGSITKTFTANLVLKAINEGKIDIDDQIDKYIDLPAKDYYPTIRRLITHTSGYEGYYFERRMLLNYLNNKNIFQNVSKNQIIKKIKEIDLKDQDYNFDYSNFGTAVVGVVLSDIYKDDYATIINNYIVNELKLENTHISNGSGDLGNYWSWAGNDAYMPAGALTSTMGDMLKYAQMQLDGKLEYSLSAHHGLTKANVESEMSTKINIHIDSVGAAWMIDKKNDIIWHNGGTDNYSCYMGLIPNNKTAVVILTNLPSDNYIPNFATVMGAKLLSELQER